MNLQSMDQAMDLCYSAICSETVHILPDLVSKLAFSADQLSVRYFAMYPNRDIAVQVK